MMARQTVQSSQGEAPCGTGSKTSGWDDHVAPSFSTSGRSAQLGEFTLEQTSLRIDANVGLVKSSQGLGWTNIYVALTTEQPHEALHRAIPAAWFATTFTGIDMRRSSIEGEQHQRFPKNLVTITAPGEAVHDEIGNPLEAMHTYLRQDILDEVAGELFSDREAKRTIVSELSTDDPVLRWFLASIKASLGDPPLSNSLKMDYLSRALASHLLHKHSTANPGRIKPAQAEALSARQVGSVADYIEANLASNLTLNELAAIVGVGRAQFLRRFKAATRMTPHQYVLMRRIQRGKRYLADLRLDHSSIAFMCGFVNQAHFASTFKRFVNMTPREFRRTAT
ncbi:AraC family transcriptional regulator [Rhizobium freirei PRF 81]|uniref:AraC family transcriptional regulator n=1 Tax=Rhizobium freirei PRF 81 TaxID=363754 RepID=N6V6A0_9HYPH|nr:AraC family transcriptional regulator [Rhizobium freirei]ENN86547.1 AraC family transcriptional regulator [Rhizobium freirei PRF 81]